MIYGYKISQGFKRVTFWIFGDSHELDYVEVFTPKPGTVLEERKNKIYERIAKYKCSDRTSHNNGSVQSAKPDNTHS